MAPRIARPSVPPDAFSPYDLIAKLGSRAISVYVGRAPRSGGASALVVLEKLPGGGKPGPASADLLRETRRIATLASPNLGRVREVVARGNDLLVVGDFVDGEKLTELGFGGASNARMPLEIAVRVLVDALAGVGALHGLRDAKQQPMRLAHGELSPATLVLGADGIARVLHAASRRLPGAGTDPASAAYLAPEVRSGEGFDARADVYGVGAMLWEALAGPRSAGEDEGAWTARSLLPGHAPWAAGLAEIARRALSASPEERWPTAAVLVAQLRKAAGLKLPAVSVVASFARDTFGERVKARRLRLETGAQPISPHANVPSGTLRPAAPGPTPPPATPSDETVTMVRDEAPLRGLSVTPETRALAARDEAPPSATPVTSVMFARDDLALNEEPTHAMKPATRSWGVLPQRPSDASPFGGPASSEVDTQVDTQVEAVAALMNRHDAPHTGPAEVPSSPTLGGVVVDPPARTQGAKPRTLPAFDIPPAQSFVPRAPASSFAPPAVPQTIAQRGPYAVGTDPILPSGDPSGALEDPLAAPIYLPMQPIPPDPMQFSSLMPSMAQPSLSPSSLGPSALPRSPRADRVRRIAIVAIAGFGGIGVLVFALAAWRATHRSADAAADVRRPHAAAIAHSPAQSPSSARPPPTATPTPAPTATSTSTVPSASASAPTPGSVAAKAPTKPAWAAARPAPHPVKASPKPRARTPFNPNSL